MQGQVQTNLVRVRVRVRPDSLLFWTFGLLTNFREKVYCGFWARYRWSTGLAHTICAMAQTSKQHSRKVDEIGLKKSAALPNIIYFS